MQINTSISYFHSINQQFYRVEMGQNQSNCYNPQAKQQDFLKTQMLTYEWRSDRRYNTFIPRVTIEFGPQALKQQQFLKFIDDSKESNYLNLEQFHSKYGLDHAKQVLVFEKYSSTLQEINDSLSLPEVVYVLTAFILGLRAIAKKFKEIIVSRRCCFITKTGQVRVWINSNEKHNYVQWELQQQIFQASNHKSILLKTLFEVLKSAKKTDNNMKLFTTLRCFLQKSNNDRDLFEATRQKISQYSGQINIELVNKLNQRLSNNPIFTNNTSSIPNQYYPPQLHQSSLINNQALKDTRATIYQNQSIFSGRQKSRSLQNQSINDKHPFFGTENRQSVIFTYNKVQAGDSNIQKTKMKASNNSSTNGFARSKILKISDIIENTQKPVPIIKISSIQLSKSSSSNAPKKVSINCINYKDQLDCQDIAQNDPLLSDNILTQNDPNLLQLNNKKAISVSERQARFNKDKNRQRKVSILEKSDSQKIQKMGSVMYARTYNQLAFDNSFKDIQMCQAPWRTHKTITRLIRDDDSDSLVHSLGTSSQSHLNEDPYKGILSKMCRDVTKKRISDVLIQ